MRRILLAVIAFCLGGCGGGSSAPSSEPSPAVTVQDAAPPPLAPVDHLSFSEISIDAGLDYIHGFLESSSSIEVAAGVAAADYDNDGWLDLYVTQGDTFVNYLFRNISRPGDYEFINVSNVAGVAMRVIDKTAAPAFADYDGDGDDDLFVGGVEYNPVKVFRNDGDGTFEDVTEASGLSAIVRENNLSMAFGDYDLDGDLDLFVAHWTFTVNEMPGGYQHLWRNNGDGTFSDVSEESLVADAIVVPDGDFTFTPNFADIDNDGDPDLLVVSDNRTSQVLINNGDQGGGLHTFGQATDQNVITDDAGMGASVADFDNDGDLDWFVSSIFEEDAQFRTGNRYYENTGNGVFIDSTTRAGVRNGYWGWASCAADFNNDGYLDIFHVNGISTGAASIFRDDPSRLFIANGDGSFSEFSQDLGLLDDKQGRGIVCFDGDQDGDIDIFIANNNDRPSLFRNDGGNSLRYLNIKLGADAPNTAAIGARIFVSSNGVTQMREISSGNNYLSQNPTEQHFGLNQAGTIDSIRVVWPDRSETTRDNISSNQRIRVIYPDTWSTD